MDYAESGEAASMPEMQVRELGSTKVVRAAKETEVDAMLSVELCAGAGGLALATTQAGFAPLALLESDPVACETITENRNRGPRCVKAWPSVEPIDVHEFDYSSISDPIDLLSGGPPCQPFSLGGKLLGIEDNRDLFAEVARAMRCLRPRAILIENTKGLSYERFERQLKYILLQLTFPEACRDHKENWQSFMARLERQVTRGKTTELRYSISCIVLNAADYGVPQNRERLIIVGFRGGEHSPFAYPAPTHSLDRLLHDQWITGEYWDRHKVTSRRRPRPPQKYKGRIRSLKDSPDLGKALPWRTVRDAIATLPHPRVKNDQFNHELWVGARSYEGHTGSFYDLPAKVLKAGRHGVPGGENMLRHPNGAVRYFTIRECARLQTFPDNYFFSGDWTNTTRQVGNAVPVLMCRRVAETVRDHLARIDRAGSEHPPGRKVAG
jgi:DNA (cytosine-5)-methyltransferase 1